ncbi:MAG: CD3324 family protein [Limnochordia bacterium]|jgi:Mor family transcriptional regulator|nr:CD3324 family protein [Limnochordia bacterium]
MYLNAEDVLPPRLLRQVQEYVQGRELYVPKKMEDRAGWGQRNGTRRKLELRNQEIRRRYAAGEAIHSLMEAYYLSYDSIRKIVRRVEGKNDSDSDSVNHG